MPDVVAVGLLHPDVTAGSQLYAGVFLPSVCFYLLPLPRFYCQTAHWDDHILDRSGPRLNASNFF